MRYTLKGTFCSSNLIKTSLSALSLIATDSEVYQKYEIMQANIQQLVILSKQKLKCRTKLTVLASNLIFTPFYSFPGCHKELRVGFIWIFASGSGSAHPRLAVQSIGSSVLC